MKKLKKKTELVQVDGKTSMFLKGEFYLDLTNNVSVKVDEETYNSVEVGDDFLYDGNRVGFIIKRGDSYLSYFEYSSFGEPSEMMFGEPFLFLEREQAELLLHKLNRRTRVNIYELVELK